MQDLSHDWYMENYVYLLYYKYKTNPNRSGSYIDSPDWIKKSKINFTNKNDDKYFYYVPKIAWNHKKWEIILQK